MIKRNLHIYSSEKIVLQIVIIQKYHELCMRVDAEPLHHSLDPTARAFNLLSLRK